MNITLNNLLDRQSIPEPIAQCAVGHSELVRPFLDGQYMPSMGECFDCTFFGRCRRFSQRLIKRPVVQPPFQRAMCDAEYPRPFVKSVRFAVVRQASSFARILPLLQSCRPEAISRLVIAIVVDTFNTVFSGRFLPHILHEVHEGPSPPIADCNSSGAIKLKVPNIWVVTSGFHCTPIIVSRRAWLAFIHANSLHLLHKGRVRFCRHGTTTSWLGRIFGRLEYRRHRQLHRPMRQGTVRCARRIGEAIRAIRLLSGDEMYRQVRSFVSPFICSARGKDCRILCSHLTFLANDWVVRAKSVHNNCLGSFHFSIT